MEQMISIEILKELFKTAREWTAAKAVTSSNTEEKLMFQGMAIQADIFLKSISGLKIEEDSKSASDLKIKEINIKDVMRSIGWN